MFYAADYIPVTTLSNGEAALDVLNARYINAFNIQPYTTFTITFREKGRLDLVCNKFFNNRFDLMQPLARYNGIVDLIEDVDVGKVIYVPRMLDLENALSQANINTRESLSPITLR